MLCQARMNARCQGITTSTDTSWCRRAHMRTTFVQVQGYPSIRDTCLSHSPLDSCRQWAPLLQPSGTLAFAWISLVSSRVPFAATHAIPATYELKNPSCYPTSCSYSVPNLPGQARLRHPSYNLLARFVLSGFIYGAEDRRRGLEVRRRLGRHDFLPTSVIPCPRTRPTMS